MNHTASSQKQFTNDWKDLYIAALFEHDKNVLPERIAAAQAAIAARKQELLTSENNADERRVLDNAAFSLQALAQCFSMGQMVAHRESSARAQPNSVLGDFR